MPRVPTSLSREVLKWIQSLDLAYSVKNAKRDFSNGFLVAEIFSRYYDKDIQMHSFDNGNSTRVKRDNWAQLMKFFRKRNVMPGGEPVSDKTVENIIHCKNGAVIVFLNQVYEYLSGRKVQTPPPPPTTDYVPPFAKPTAATVLRDSMRDPDFHISDMSRAEQKMKETLDGHEKGLQADRMADPSRFNTSAARAPSKILRGPTRTVGAEERKQTVTVKKVQVKQVDANVAQLRATKEMHASGSRLASNSLMSSHTAGDVGGGSVASAAPRAVASAMGMLNKAVAAGLRGSDVLDSLDGSKPLALAFMDAVLATPDMPDDLVAAAMREAGRVTDALSESCLANPREFWKVVSVYQPLISKVPVDAPAFRLATENLSSLGDAMVTKDAATATSLFNDFAMRPLCAVIKANPAKRHDVLAVIYAYSASWEDHPNVIRLLQETLDDLPTFISCLTRLIYLESEFDPDLLDIYQYYCRIGMGMTSPSLRAASLGMLAVLADSNPEAVARDVPRLAALRDDPWWEVQAQVAIVCSVLMTVMGPEDATAQAAARIVSVLLGSSPPPAATRVAVSHLAKNLTAFPSIATPYVSAVLKLPPSARMSLLSDGGGKDGVVRGAALSSTLGSLPEQWDAALVGQAVADIASRDSLPRLDAEHFQVLSAALYSDNLAANEGNWVRIFQSLKHFIYIALCDGDIAQTAVQVLRKLGIETSLGASVFSDPMMLGTIRMMHSGDQDDPVAHQTTLSTLLDEVVSQGDEYVAAVRSVLGEFKSTSQAQYDASPLAGVGARIGL